MNKKQRKFTTAPLPFMGQKRKFLKHFTKALENYPHNAIYVDLFGGSGLLSHNVKQLYPQARVIYNDYDNYSERLRNIEKTNALLADFRLILKNHTDDKRIEEPLRSMILDRLKIENELGYVDWISVSSSILFSMKYMLNFEDVSKSTLYNTMRQSDFHATGYLEGVEIVRFDYKQLFDKFKDNNEVVFLCDPPYLSTNVEPYQTDWKMTDYLNVLQVLKDTRYFYFTSNKSSIIELCQWMHDSSGVLNPFQYATTVSMSASASYNATYTDIMLYK